LTVQRFEQP